MRVELDKQSDHFEIKQVAEIPKLGTGKTDHRALATLLAKE